MPNPFVPETPERFTDMKVSGKEADLIKKLRLLKFAKFTVHKAAGVLIRVEVQESQLLTEESGLDIQGE